MLNSTFQIKKITFNQILTIWESMLWPRRISSIKTHSSMTLAGGIDMKIYNNTATYFGIVDKEKLIAVNSGHRSSSSDYRSRGLWVDPDYRRIGLGRILLTAAQNQARLENCTLIWSMPRKQSLSVYLSAGFKQHGDFFPTETADLNCYALMNL